MIPQVEGTFEEMDAVRERLRQVKSKVDVLEMIWGSEIRAETNPERREYMHYMSELEGLKQDFESATRRFTEIGVTVKSVEAGLVDFYGVIDSHLVFLCWKRGEEHVTWYHHVEEGFPGRQEIPEEELAR